MDYSDFPLPKPDHHKRKLRCKPRERGVTETWGVVHHRDGREVCDETKVGKEEYRRRLDVMHTRQHGHCGLCAKPLTREQATFDHQFGRGMNGSKRDDRTEKPDEHGKLRWLNAAVHFICNGEKGSRIVPYLITQETAHLYSKGQAK